MTEGNGSRELVRIATAYLASVAFGLTFLTATFCGTDGLTAVFRSAIAVLAACVAGQLLIPPVVETVLAAMARDEAKRQAEQQAEEDQ